jgi:glycosyltransferase involved in cell wall biosynthesis
MSRSLCVVIPTKGRPAIAARLARELERQTRRPDHVYVVGASPDDVAQVERREGVTVLSGRPGLCAQRNDALDAGAAAHDVIVFFDDDFAPSRFWLERVEALFEARSDIVAVTGAVLADGAKTPGIAPDEAWGLVEARDAVAPREEGFEPDAEPFGYGCNIAFRGSVARPMRFDERLPLYGWLEDRDFTARMRRSGLYGRSMALWGVHMGAKGGRVSGVKLGYSQIANVAYLVEKGTATPRYAVNLAGRNILANLAHSLKPEPWIDRRGRLRGNMLALADLARGKARPERALEL